MEPLLACPGCMIILKDMTFIVMFGSRLFKRKNYWLILPRCKVLYGKPYNSRLLATTKKQMLRAYFLVALAHGIVRRTGRCSSLV